MSTGLAVKQARNFRRFCTSAYRELMDCLIGERMSRTGLLAILVSGQAMTPAQRSNCERLHAEFRGEFFNMLNHTNFGHTGAVFNSPTFGVIGSAGPLVAASQALVTSRTVGLSSIEPPNAA